MVSTCPHAVLITRDLAVVHATYRVIRSGSIDWRQCLASGLIGITQDTDTLIIDANVGASFAYLLASLFLDQQPGRRAVVLRDADASVRASADPRVPLVDLPLDPGRLEDALAEAEALELACAAVRGSGREARRADEPQRQIALVSG